LEEGEGREADIQAIQADKHAILPVGPSEKVSDASELAASTPPNWSGRNLFPKEKWMPALVINSLIAIDDIAQLALDACITNPK
jgi:hypothetical protein